MNSEKGDGFRLKIPQLVAGLFIWAMVGCLIWFTRDLPYFQEGAPGPRFMPILLAIFLGILNTLYWIDAFFFRSQAKITLPRPSQLIRPAGFVLIGLFMILLWEHLGVVPTVLVSSFLELKVIEEYSWTDPFWSACFSAYRPGFSFSFFWEFHCRRGFLKGCPFYKVRALRSDSIGYPSTAVPGFFSCFDP